MKILFVATINSVHTARWLSQLRGLGWDVHLFPAEWPAEIHEALRDVTLHGVGLWRPAGLHPSVKVAGLWPFTKGAFRVSQWVGRHAPEFLRRDRLLARVIRRIKPDMVHALEMQKSGYLTLGARGLLQCGFPPLIYSCWGSDLYYFGKIPEHEERIRSVLAACGYFTADCHRDAELARTFGFKGVDLGSFPGGGGFAIDEMLPHRHPLAGRRLIAVKGHDYWAGRARLALQAIHRCADILQGYEIVVYSAPPHVEALVEHIAAVSGLPVRVMPQEPHEAVVKLMGRSRLALGISVSEGTPNTMLEAMIMGALPVVSDTGSTAEWISDGVNGLLVPPEDLPALERAIRRGIADNGLVERAAAHNADLTRRRVDRSVVLPRTIALYERVLRERCR